MQTRFRFRQKWEMEHDVSIPTFNGGLMIVVLKSQVKRKYQIKKVNRYES
jgi:hypothetical protein